MQQDAEGQSCTVEQLCSDELGRRIGSISLVRQESKRQTIDRQGARPLGRSIGHATEELHGRRFPTCELFFARRGEHLSHGTVSVLAMQHRELVHR
jgi:hypothetical protein